MTSDPERGRRAYNKQRVRQQITDAAFHLFLDRGLSETTVEDIVSVAGVSRRTFYRYFSSARDIIQAWDQTIADGLADAARARPAGEALLVVARAAVLEVFSAYFHDQSRSIALIRLIGEATHGRTFVAESAAIWAEGLRRGLDARGGAAPQAAQLAANMTISIWQVCWLSLDSGERLPDEAHGVFGLADALFSELLLERAATSLRRPA